MDLSHAGLFSSKLALYGFLCAMYNHVHKRLNEAGFPAASVLPDAQKPQSGIKAFSYVVNVFHEVQAILFCQGILLLLQVYRQLHSSLQSMQVGLCMLSFLRFVELNIGSPQ